jgi:hypothetical protein
MFHGENHREIQKTIVAYLLVNAKNETQLKKKKRYTNKTEQNTTDICQRRHHPFFALSSFIQK